MDAFIPDDYIGDRTLKMSFYQRLANFTQPEQVEAIAAEMSDRFGTPPEPVANLLALVRLKTEAAELGFEYVGMRDGEIVLKLKRTVAPDRIALYKRFRNDISVTLGEIRLPRRHFTGDGAAWLAQLRDLLPVVVGKKPVAPDGRQKTRRDRRLCQARGAEGCRSAGEGENRWAAGRATLSSSILRSPHIPSIGERRRCRN